MTSIENITKAKLYLITSITANENFSLVRDILCSQFPVDSTLDSQNTTSLILATKKSSPDFVNLCLDCGSNVTATDTIGFTALHYAC